MMKACIVALALVGRAYGAEAVDKPTRTGHLGKSTYAMSHPWAFKTFMESYFPTAVQTEMQNSTDKCVEWVKLCIDDGSGTQQGACKETTGAQLHSVGAYERDSGAKSLEEIEGDRTTAMGDMSTYDPYFESNVGFLTKDLAYYADKFANDSVPHFHSTFAVDGTSYDSVIVQVPGSLKAGAKSLLNLQLLGATTEALRARPNRVRHPAAGPSPTSLRGASAALETADRAYGSTGAPVLSIVHVSWASSDVDRDSKFFEGIGGIKQSATDDGGVATYNGLLGKGETAEFRYVEHDAKTRGPVSVADWEAYQVDLHSKCFVPSKNVGFDRLADNHIGHAQHAIPLDTYIKAQEASSLPYRIYGPPGKGSPPWFFYGYGPNGWGYQLTGTCTDKSLCPKAPFYDMCTQGVLPNCQAA